MPFELQCSWVERKLVQQSKNNFMGIQGPSPSAIAGLAQMLNAKKAGLFCGSLHPEEHLTYHIIPNKDSPYFLSLQNMQLT